jgi:hypothetical protein
MAELIDPAKATDTRQLRRLFEAVRRALAPEMTSRAYYDAVSYFESSQMNRFETLFYQDQVPTAEQAAGLPDNSDDYEKLAFSYHGLDRVQELLADGGPVAFVGWHHGARNHADYALARIFPRIAILTRWMAQYGKVFSIPMATAGGLGLVKMRRLLSDGRPIFYYLDGAPEGDCVQLPVMGVMSNFSTSPIKLFQSVAGLRIVPVTNFYIGETGVEVNFHPALGTDRKLADFEPRDILAVLLERLEQDQRRRGPGQVLINFLPHREFLAQQARQARARESEHRNTT